jgi:hypothetical protein
VLLALPAPAAAAEPRWGVRVVAFGSYALDYGEEQNAVDGQGTGTWRWAMKAVASGLNIDTGTAIFRMTVEEQSDIVLQSSTPYCRPPAGPREVDWVRDPSVGLYLSPGGGFQVNHGFFDLLAGCHVGAHGMSLYDGATPGEVPVRRGAFRPRRHNLFEDTWTQVISLDPTHESEASSAHSFHAEGTIRISVRRLSRRAARALRLRLRSTPRTPGA